MQMNATQCDSKQFGEPTVSFQVDFFFYRDSTLPCGNCEYLNIDKYFSMLLYTCNIYIFYVHGALDGVGLDFAPPVQHIR